MWKIIIEKNMKHRKWISKPEDKIDVARVKNNMWCNREKLGEEFSFEEIWRKVSEELAFRWGQRSKNGPAMLKAEEAYRHHFSGFLTEQHIQRPWGRQEPFVVMVWGSRSWRQDWRGRQVSEWTGGSLDEEFRSNQSLMGRLWGWE